MEPGQWTYLSLDDSFFKEKDSLLPYFSSIVSKDIPLSRPNEQKLIVFT